MDTTRGKPEEEKVGVWPGSGTLSQVPFVPILKFLFLRKGARNDS